ncbi:toxin-activating lysine-acyltransferase [Ascidiaceihabitans sp.]|uniref:toxin-activating lysine-acyltransferase n=1 Tax=Ascidiaceihabitans sp. TaxID=1872644 RepID=UPI00329776F9
MGTNKTDVPTSEEFTSTLGKASWLLAQSALHKNMPVSWIEPNIMAPLMFKQLRVFTRGNQPLAFLTWGYVSFAVSERLKHPDYQIALTDWRSGPDVAVVECVSPFVDGEQFKINFLKEVEQAKAARI